MLRRIHVNRQVVGVLTIALAIAIAGGAHALATPPLTKGVYTGVITVGRGAAGVTLGMTPAQVIARLGRPFKPYGNRVMEYSGNYSRGLFEVYLKRGRVQMIVIDGRPRSGWRLADGNHVFDRGGWARLIHRYGRSLRLMHTETGEPYYRITGHFLGRTSWTDFSVWPLNSRGMVEGITIQLR